MSASESKFKKAKYEDKPEFATIISGGMLFSAFFYWISNNILNNLNIDNQIIPFILPLIIFLFSFQLATKPIAEIEINLETGFVYAKDKIFEYEGYSDEPEIFLVLEKIIDQRRPEMKEYKISMKIDEETTFEIPLKNSEVREAIKNIENAKNKSKLR